MQLQQQQLQASTAAGAPPCVTDAVSSAETDAAAESERQTVAAEKATGALVAADANPDSPQGAVSPSPSPPHYHYPFVSPF